MTGIIIAIIAIAGGVGVGSIAHKAAEANTRNKAMKEMLKENNNAEDVKNEKAD